MMVSLLDIYGYRNKDFHIPVILAEPLFLTLTTLEYDSFMGHGRQKDNAWCYKHLLFLIGMDWALSTTYRDNYMCEKIIFIPKCKNYIYTVQQWKSLHIAQE